MACVFNGWFVVAVLKVCADVCVVCYLYDVFSVVLCCCGVIWRCACLMACEVKIRCVFFLFCVFVLALMVCCLYGECTVDICCCAVACFVDGFDTV